MSTHQQPAGLPGSAARSIDLVLGRLEKVRSSGPRKWSACCPAHEDRDPSLHVAEGDDGKVLIYCFAGCDTKDVLASIGLEWRDLFPEGLSVEARIEYRRSALQAAKEKAELLVQIAAANVATLSDDDVLVVAKAGQDLPRIKAELDRLQVSPHDIATVDVHGMPPVETWPHVSDKGRPLNTIPNLEHLLSNYGFTVRYDVIRKDLVISYPGQCGTADNQRETAVNEILSLCALNRLPKTETAAFLLNVGDQAPLNPVMDFIKSKPWDGRSRFSDLLETVQTRHGFDRDWFALLLRRWLVSAAAAAASPAGFWSKGVLVFQGEQSLGKTAWFRALLPESLRDLLKVDAHIDPDNKDSIISAVSHWLVELGELDGTLRKADIARLKGFISQDVDQFRRPYARAEGKYGRRTVFFASVNPEHFLADETGNVRWWTVPVTGVNEKHGIDMQQLWAEVFEWFKAGDRWWLERDEEARLESHNANHQQTDPVEELIQEHYGTAPASAVRRPMTATSVLLEIGYDRPTQRQRNDAGRTLRRLFGEPKKTKAGLLFDVPSLAIRPF